MHVRRMETDANVRRGCTANVLLKRIGLSSPYLSFFALFYSDVLITVFHCLQVVRTTSGAVVTGNVCLTMLCVTKRRTVKMEATRPLVKPVSGSSTYSLGAFEKSPARVIYKYVTQTIKQLTYVSKSFQILRRCCSEDFILNSEYFSLFACF